MTDRTPEHPEGDKVDGVSAFFAEQLRSVQSQPAAEDRWEQIVHEAGRPRRQPWWGLAAGTAAALAIGTAAWSMQQSPFGGDDVTKGDVVQANKSTTRGGFAPPVGAREVPQVQSARAVDPKFVTWSLTNAGNGTLYALGGSPCSNGTCPTVLRSTDNGTSWQAVHSFSSTDTTSTVGGQQPAIQPGRAVTEVRFLNPQVGYVFAGDLQITQDRGQKFTPIVQPGQTVLDVEIHNEDVVILTSGGCADGQCDGSLNLSRVKGGSAAQAERIASRKFTGSIEDAQLVVRAGNIFVQPTRSESGPATPWRLDGNDLVDVTSSACQGKPLQALTATANGGTTLFAACGGDAQGALARYSLQSSADNGRTWKAAPAPLVLPRTGRLTLAAVDAKHVVAAVGGPRATRGGAPVGDPRQTLQVTADAGNTWHATGSTAKPSSGGFDWVASPGGAEVYAIPRTTSAYWHSVDQGRTWSQINPARPPKDPSGTSSPASPTSRR